MYEALLVRVGFKFWECSGWNIFFQHPTPDISHERVVYWRCVRMVILLSCSEGRYRENQNMWYNILRSFVDDRQTVRVIISCVLFCFLIFSSAQKSVSFMNGQIFTALVIILPLYYHISCIVSPAMMWYDRPVYDVMWYDMISVMWYDMISSCRDTLHALPFPPLPFPSLISLTERRLTNYLIFSLSVRVRSSRRLSCVLSTSYRCPWAPDVVIKNSGDNQWIRWSVYYCGRE